MVFLCQSLQATASDGTDNIIDHILKASDTM